MQITRKKFRKVMFNGIGPVKNTTVTIIQADALSNNSFAMVFVGSKMVYSVTGCRFICSAQLDVCTHNLGSLVHEYSYCI